jgi:hypothetical protein
MHHVSVCLFALVTIASSCSSTTTEPTPPPGPRDRWTEAEAAAWYAKQPWLVGVNFLPSTAVNQLEMWQPETYDEATIDRELRWAADLGFNTMRVFLHHLLWEADPSSYDELEPYVKGVIERFRTDRRVVAWDLFNEPDNANPACYLTELDAETKSARAAELLQKAFEWARGVGPVQPITAGVFKGDWSEPEALAPINSVMLEESDVISFHGYAEPEVVSEWISDLKQYDRPILCTEYMARPVNLFHEILPIFKAENVAGYNWGLVTGRSQTNYSWTSWAVVVPGPPDPWFHDVLHSQHPRRGLSGFAKRPL